MKPRPKPAYRPLPLGRNKAVFRRLWRDGGRQLPAALHHKILTEALTAIRQQVTEKNKVIVIEGFGRFEPRKMKARPFINLVGFRDSNVRDAARWRAYTRFLKRRGLLPWEERFGKPKVVK